MNKWLYKFMEKPDISDKPDKWDENLENMHGVGPDKSDIFTLGSNLSDLSGRPPGLLDENFSPYEEYDFNERLAIVEYDGEASSIEAHRIAYLDAFISTLTSLPATASQRDWLDMRIQTALAWIEAQEYRTIN